MKAQITTCIIYADHINCAAKDIHHNQVQGQREIWQRQTHGLKSCTPKSGSSRFRQGPEGCHAYLHSQREVSAESSSQRRLLPQYSCFSLIKTSICESGWLLYRYHLSMRIILQGTHCHMYG